MSMMTSVVAGPELNTLIPPEGVPAGTIAALDTIGDTAANSRGCPTRVPAAPSSRSERTDHHGQTGLERLDLFHLGEHGDRHERAFWPLLSKLFPSYEILWRRLIVPLTCRIDPNLAASPEQWIRLRPSIPPRYEQASMAHYSVFYFLGRAAKRCAEEKTALEYPEDVLFLLDSVGDNLKHFRRAMNDLAADCGRTGTGMSNIVFCPTLYRSLNLMPPIGRRAAPLSLNPSSAAADVGGGRIDAGENHGRRICPGGQFVRAAQSVLQYSAKGIEKEGSTAIQARAD
jgi:hypothetical protein